MTYSPEFIAWLEKDRPSEICWHKDNLFRAFQAGIEYGRKNPEPVSTSPELN